MSEVQQSLISFQNHHASSCGEPPFWDTSQGYWGYYENIYGEQWVFHRPPLSETAYLWGGDAQWDHTYTVRDGVPQHLGLNAEETRWLRACWLSVWRDSTEYGERYAGPMLETPIDTETGEILASASPEPPAPTYFIEDEPSPITLWLQAFQEAAERQTNSSPAEPGGAMSLYWRLCLSMFLCAFLSGLLAFWASRLLIGPGAFNPALGLPVAPIVAFCLWLALRTKATVCIRSRGREHDE